MILVEETKERLRCFRKEAGFTQIELAETLGVSRQIVERWEGYGRNLPPLDRLDELAVLYGLESLDELIVRDKKKRKAEKYGIKQER